jgi:threonine dehydrogenase-like Zn-dependent dehydrogenase
MHEHSEQVDAVAAALPAGDGALEVSGDGPLAAALRSRLGCGSPNDADPPPAVLVETTGGAQAIRDALWRVADLGTVVLAGELEAGPVELDLYGDLHVRGLTIVGVAPAAGAGAP